MTMGLWRAAESIVLASRSAPRRMMLQNAGIPVEVDVPDLDERKLEARAGPLDPAAAALFLAGEKASAVARRHPDRLVIGADQTLSLAQGRFDKPNDRDAARHQLAALSGMTHRLHAAVAVACNERLLFRHVEDAALTMRILSPTFLEAYLDAAGDAVLASVGCYQLERLGVHLFERVDGDHFTI